MTNDRFGYYFDGKRTLRCRIKRIGGKNTRIVLENDDEMVVANEFVEIDASTIRSLANRLVPTIPLEILYRRLRDARGSSKDRFESLRAFLDGMLDLTGADFLCELFRRSVRHAEGYCNTEESFYTRRADRNNIESDFAKSLVAKIRLMHEINIGEIELKFADYEIYPFRTTRSFLEDGLPATHAGSGGMDLLLATSNDDVLPVIGEIKAGTEIVGPTFALIQSLMYAAQILTPNQFKRLREHYPLFERLNAEAPKAELVVFFDEEELPCNEDLQYAQRLAGQIGEQLKEHLRRISFVSCRMENNSIAFKFL